MWDLRGGAVLDIYPVRRQVHRFRTYDFDPNPLLPVHHQQIRPFTWFGPSSECPISKLLCDKSLREACPQLLFLSRLQFAEKLRVSLATCNKLLTGRDQVVTDGLLAWVLNRQATL